MNPLHEMIRRLPPRVEFLVVVMWAFGLPIFGSILSLGADGLDLHERQYSNANLTSVLIIELMQSAFLIWFLRIRGWTLEKLGLSVSVRTTVLGLVLCVGAVGLLLAVQYVGQNFMPVEYKAAMDRLPRPADDLSMGLVLTVATVNGIFEEVFVAGYIVSAVAPVRGVWTAINVSTGVRLLCYLYQGPLGILSVVPLGLLFGYTYARTRQLWPLILAHVLVDIVAFVQGAS